MINSKYISVVVQGAIDKQNTPLCLASIRKFLPGSEIILSTWKGSDTTDLDYDVLIENIDPDAISYRSNGAVNNLNRQIVSSHAGLDKVQRKYALKFRTDLIMTSDSFLAYFDKFPKRNNEYKIFDHRVLTSTLFSRENIIGDVNGFCYKCPLAPSDWWFLGLTEDVKKIFDIQLVEEPYFSQYFTGKRKDDDFMWRFPPEQYIGNNLLKHNPAWAKYEMTDTDNYPFETIELSKQLLTNNFIFLGFKESGIYMNKYMPWAKDERQFDYRQYNGLITYYKFLKNYKRYCDNDYKIPDKIKDHYNGAGFELDEISFIIQGEHKPEIYQQITQNIRKFFPNAEIVLATYTGTDIKGLDYDKIALVKDPGSFPYNNQPNAKTNNINRQILTTLNGLKVATRKYAFKLRSDFVLNGRDFLSYFNQCPKSDPKYNIFDHKILSSTFFARDPRAKNKSLPFHPSDLAFFGLRTDLLNLFDIPLMTKEESTYYKHKNSLYCRYLPEQYLWINCLRKNGKNIVCDHQRDCNDSIAEETERYIASNFIYLDYEQFNLTPTEKLRLFSENEFDNIITHIEWQKLYKQYVDITHQVPDKDKVRDTIMHKFKRIRQYAILAKYMVFLIPLKGIRRSLRRRLIKHMTKDIRL